MPLFKFFKALICEISHAPLTSSKANIFRFSSVAPSERRVVNIFKNTRTSVVTVTSAFTKIVNGKSKIFQTIRAGVVWDTDGHIVTNYNVIRDVAFSPDSDFKDRSVHVLTSEGVEEMHNAQIVGANHVDDLVVLKITTPRCILKPITVGESTIVEVGQKCLLIGAPRPYRHSLASGIISGLNRIVDFEDRSPMNGMIQVDASSNTGNIGGPLLDYNGHMIGIHKIGIEFGIAMCIPSSVVVKTVTQLIKFKKLRSWL